MHFQSARDIALDPASVSETVHDYVHGLVYSRCPSCSYFPCLCYVVSTLHIDVHNVISLTVFRFRCMKRCVQLEDDSVLSAQCQRFATLSLRDIGLQKNLQSSSEQPFLASIRLLQVRLRSLAPALHPPFFPEADAARLSEYRVVDVASSETSTDSRMFQKHCSGVRINCKFCKRWRCRLRQLHHRRRIHSCV
jgi:hypothetical protein